MTKKKDDSPSWFVPVITDTDWPELPSVPTWASDLYDKPSKPSLATVQAQADELNKLLVKAASASAPPAIQQTHVPAQTFAVDIPLDAAAFKTEMVICGCRGVEIGSRQHKLLLATFGGQYRVSMELTQQALMFRAHAQAEAVKKLQQLSGSTAHIEFQFLATPQIGSVSYALRARQTLPAHTINVLVGASWTPDYEALVEEYQKLKALSALHKETIVIDSLTGLGTSIPTKLDEVKHVTEYKVHTPSGEIESAFYLAEGKKVFFKLSPDTAVDLSYTFSKPKNYPLLFLHPKDLKGASSDAADATALALQKDPKKEEK